MCSGFGNRAVAAEDGNATASNKNAIFFTCLSLRMDDPDDCAWKTRLYSSARVSTTPFRANGVATCAKKCRKLLQDVPSHLLYGTKPGVKCGFFFRAAHRDQPLRVQRPQPSQKCGGSLVDALAPHPIERS